MYKRVIEKSDYHKRGSAAATPDLRAKTLVEVDAVLSGVGSSCASVGTSSSSCRCILVEYGLDFDGFSFAVSIYTLLSLLCAPISVKTSWTLVPSFALASKNNKPLSLA